MPIHKIAKQFQKIVSRHSDRRRRTGVGSRQYTVEVLESRVVLSATPVISEFMADNDDAHADGDGNFSDWIEIYNPGDAAVDLQGWFLTDDASDPDKWAFPSVTIDPDSYLVVYASGQASDNYVDAGGHLHTNFSLSRGGEYLGLYDGTTVAHEFSPEYPSQEENVSYGIGVETTSTEFVGASTPLEYLIPEDNTLEPAWRGAGFTDPNLVSSTPGPIGYDVQDSAVYAIDFGTSGSAVESGFTKVTKDGNSPAVPNTGGGALGSITAKTISTDGSSDEPGGATTDLTRDYIYDDGNSQAVGVELTGLAAGEWQLEIWSWDHSDSGSMGNQELEVHDGGTNGTKLIDSFDIGAMKDNAGWETAPAVTTTFTSSHVSEKVVIYLLSRIDGDTDQTRLNAIRLTNMAEGLPSIVNVDIEDEMVNESTSAYVRYPFDVTDPSALDALELQMRYDDGFVAYLNGTEVQRANVAGIASYDSVALSDTTEIQEFVEFDISEHLGLLTAGENVLAIHGFNAAIDSSEFFIDARLTGFDRTPQSVGFLDGATPGSANSESFLGFVGDTAFDVDRGFFDAPFDLTITTPQTPDAAIYYTTDGSLPSASNPSATLYSGPVQIAGTTMLRAIGVKTGFESSNVDTQTYLFLDNVIQQDVANLPQSYPEVWTGGGSCSRQLCYGDYNMDPDMATDTGSPYYEPTLKDDLKAIPTMSIVMDHEDLWGDSTGIYNHSKSRGESWRRPTSVEYFDPNTGETFQVDAGVQAHGGGSRTNDGTRKHSLRLIFREDFGATKLRYPLFKDTTVEEFNTLVLRSFYTDSFAARTKPGRYNPSDSQYLRDVWMKDSQIDMGHLSGHNTYVHLYLNGLYWGLYNPTERPDEVFMADHLGGDRDDYDIIRDQNELEAGNKDAWDQMFAIANAGLETDAAYQKIQGNNPDGTPNPNLPNLLDVENLIDYMILHLYFGAEDWPGHNWAAGRNRVAETKGFQFIVWDQEIGLDQYQDRTEVSTNGTPARLYSKLRANSEFRLRFADRVHHHLFNGGALTDEAAQQRWMARADSIHEAIVAESARWGDARVDDPNGTYAIDDPLTRADWIVQRDHVVNEVIPTSRSLAISRFTADDLYTSVAPAEFTVDGALQHGGQVAGDDLIGMDASAGTVYYTLDGTDPRLPGGAINLASAIEFINPFALASSGTIKARVLSGGDWSALTEAFFTLESPLRITEVMYNPDGSDDTEFIEVVNTSSVASVSIAGVHFDGSEEGIEFTFAAGESVLGPGERIVVVRDQTAFAEKYETAGMRIAVGEYDGSGAKLSNDGEQITLYDAAGGLIQQFTYNDIWHKETDGDGFSLVVIDVAGDYDVGTNWRSSALLEGSPGEADPEALDADFNGNGRVGRDDIVALLHGYGKMSEANRRTGDADNNGNASLVDLAITQSQFGDEIEEAAPSAQASAVVTSVRESKVDDDRIAKLSVSRSRYRLAAQPKRLPTADHLSTVASEENQSRTTRRVARRGIRLRANVTDYVLSNLKETTTELRTVSRDRLFFND